MPVIIGRRKFITTLGGAAAWPLVARAQPAALIGYLNIGAHDEYGAADAFRQGLHETGYVEGQNVRIEYRWAEHHYDRLSAMAADLVHNNAALIAAAGTSAALAAKAATDVIPIVFETAGDPVALGLVGSFNRPGGNVTGVTQLSSELISKRLGLLHDLIPTAKLIALLVEPKDARAEAQSREMEAAAHALGLHIRVLYASTEREVEVAFDDLAQLRADALLVGPGNLFTEQREQLVSRAARHRMPVIYQYRLYAEAGGLISYGASLTESYRLAGTYAGRLLKGEKVADLPVARATKFELVINLRAAKALGLSIPSGVLAIADEVIE
jgi:putative ABC transport system substrate-binding protein